jgi:hypothetical protein
MTKSTTAAVAINGMRFGLQLSQVYQKRLHPAPHYLRLVR